MTGSIGDVMKESVSIAQMYTKLFLATNFPGHPAQRSFESLDIHMHVPEHAARKVSS